MRGIRAWRRIVQTAKGLDRVGPALDGPREKCSRINGIGRKIEKSDCWTGGPRSKARKNPMFSMVGPLDRLDPKGESLRPRRRSQGRVPSQVHPAEKHTFCGNAP